MNSSMNPLVSVVLPVYNRPSVVNTIDSILNQDYDNFELIIIDNCSEDNTVNLIKAYNDSRIRLVCNSKNMGQTFSISKGLMLARGKYVARIDADDIATTDRLSKQVDFMEKNEDYGFCGSWVQFITDNNVKTYVIKTCQTDKGLRFLQTVVCGMYHPCVLIRNEILHKYNINYNSNYHMAEDYDLWFQLLCVTKGMNIPNVLLYYRRGSNNDSKIHAKLVRKEYFEVREKICRSFISDNKELETMLNVLRIEKKDKRNIFDAVYLLGFYKKYLNKYMSIKDADYHVVRKSIRNQVVTSLLTYNEDVIFIVLKHLYEFVKRVYIKSKGE